MIRVAAAPGRQKGLSLIGLALMGALVGLVAVLTLRVAPAVIEYFTVLKDARAVAGSADITTVTDVRNAFMKRAQVDSIDAVTPADLDISKDGNQIVINFAYTKKIPLFGPVSLTIDFQGGTALGGK